MITLSASQIKQYASCRFQYFDRYRLFQFGAQDTSGLLGTAVHKAIELRYTKYVNPLATLQKTLAETLAQWQDSGKEINYRYSYAEMINDGRAILEGFNFDQFQPKELEFAFTLPFDENVKMRGYIDLITHDGLVVDFKTAKRKPSRSMLNDDWQFAIYSWAYRETYGTLPSAVYWYHLRTHQVVPFDVSQTDAKIEEIKQVVKTLQADDFSDVVRTDTCSNCPPWCLRSKRNDLLS